MFNPYKPVEQWETQELATYLNFINASIISHLLPPERLNSISVVEAWEHAINAVELYNSAMEEITKRKSEYDDNVKKLDNLL